MKCLHLDYETYSEADLPKVGAHKYAEHESTEILMTSYYMEGWSGVKQWVPAEGQPMPEDLDAAFRDAETTLVAFNASFERQITRNCLPQYDIPETRWRCAMVDAMAMGLPGQLSQAGPAALMPAELFKQEGGRKLINKFCKPRKPTKKIAATRLTREHAPEEWAQFKAYNIQDTVAEAAIWEKLENWRLPDAEQALWEMDQRINDHGVRVDYQLAYAAHQMGLMHRARLVEKAKAITGLDNPNSVKQLMDWLNDQPDFDPDEKGAEVEDLRKKTVEKILGREDLDDVVREVLELRQQIAKSSLKKYDVLLRATCDDGYIHGTVQFYGASRTGRWAGRLLQVQNLPQGVVDDVDLLRYLREIVRAGDYAALVWMYGVENVSAILATLIRTCLIASPGNDLLVVDFSAIESVVTAWFADCTWRMDVFRTHGKIYEASAAAAFHLSLPEILDYKKRTGKHHPIRKKGKVIELACLGRDTQVKTASGWKRIADISLSDLIWDGVAWVTHSGAISRGMKEVIEIDGITCTPDHLFLDGDGHWAEADSFYHKDIDGRHEVVDILECGPRNRFLIRGKKSEHIVHNCGFGGGENAMVNMGALEQGLSKDELKPMVEAWRAASPEIAGTKNAKGWRDGGIWKTLEEAAKKCLRTKTRQEAGKCVFRYAGGKLVITLPNGRHLHYAYAKLKRNNRGSEAIHYWGIDQRTKRWGEQTTWGGKLLENIVQAFSRDCLCTLMTKLDARGYTQVMLVHDEVVMDIPKDFGSLEEVLALMKEPIPWAPGLPLKGAGYRNDFYFKD